MPDLYLGAAPRDVPRLSALIDRLKLLRLDVWVPPRPDVADPAKASQALTHAKAVLVVWTRRSCQDQDLEKSAMTALRARNIVALKLEPCTPPVAFHRLPTVDGEGMFEDHEHFAWAQLIKQIEALVGRSGLVNFDRTLALRNPDALRAWADAHLTDPLAEDCFRLAREIEEEEAVRRTRQARHGVRRTGLPFFGADADSELGRFLDKHAVLIGAGAMGVLSAGVAAVLFALIGPGASGRQDQERLRIESKLRGSGAVITAAPGEGEGFVASSQGQGRELASSRPSPSATAVAVSPRDLLPPQMRDLATRSPVLGSSLASAQYAAMRSEEAARIAVEMANRAVTEGGNGLGEVTLSDGAVYRGQVENGQPKGFGVRTDPGPLGGAEFQGAIDGVFGRTVWPSGLAFVGGHEKGRPWGVGAVSYTGGERYMGGFDGGRTGYGVVMGADGAIRQAGRWRNDALEESVQLKSN